MAVDTTENTVRAAVYCRISKDPTGKRAGVDRQERECCALAERLGWPVAGVYVDNDISAYKRKRRPDYETLLAGIEGGAINAVIAWHPDRLHRRPIELEGYIDICERHRVQNHTVQAGLWDLSTPSGRAVARTLGAWANSESEHKSERIKASQADRALAGKHQGGIRCFGYEGGKVADGGGMVIRQGEAAEIRRLAEAVISGQSLRSLARELNERDVQTVTGKRWSSAHLGRMLVRPRLAGLRAHNGKIVGAGLWQAILDRETWEACKAVLEDPARCTGSSGRRGPVPTTLGTGLYVCGVCGEPRLRLGRNNSRKAAYKCGNIGMDSSMGHVTRVAEKLDAYVEGALLEKISQPGVIEALCNVVDTDDEELAALRTEQTTIRPRLNKAATRYAAGEIDDEQFGIVSKTLRDKDNEITALLTAANMRSPLDLLLGVDNIEKAWDEILTMGQKRAILAEVLTVTVLPTTGGGRAPDGSYFNQDAVRIELTGQARSALSS
jgi:site-specific DNA recombinase